MKQLLLFDLILPMGGAEVIRNGFVLLENTFIKNIGSQSDLAQSIEDCEVLEFPHSVCLPGFINNHTHLAYPRYYKEVRAGQQLDWITGLVQHSRNLTSAEKFKIASENVQSCLQSGTTFIVENTPFEETVQAIANSPLKALVGLEVFGNDPQKATAIFNHSIHLLRDLEEKFDNTKIHFTFSPHTIYNVSSTLLQKLMNWAEEHNKLLLTHLSEFDFEVDLTQSGYPSAELTAFHKVFKQAAPYLNDLHGLSPVEYLKEIGCLNSRLLATHLAKASKRDLNLLAESKTNIVSCPRSNVYLQNALPLLEAMLEKGLSVSFSTDGLSSNFDLSPLAEIKAAWQLSASRGYNIKAEAFFEAITSIPAQQLGLSSSIGTLAVGKQADLVCFDLQASLCERLEGLKTKDEIYFFLLSELHEKQIKQVFIDGVAQLNDKM